MHVNGAYVRVRAGRTPGYCPSTQNQRYPPRACAWAHDDRLTKASTVMYDTDTKNQFLELRAKGWSLSRLAERLNVVQRTLVDWNRQELRKKLHRFCLTFASPKRERPRHLDGITPPLHQSINPSHRAPRHL